MQVRQLPFGRCMLLALLAALIVPATASAVQRFASPPGATPAPGGIACTQPAPCSLQTAVESAANGDEVIINAGTYNEGGNPLLATVGNLDIHGVSGQPKPMITGTAAGQIQLLSPGQRLSDIRIEHTAATTQTAVIANGDAQVSRIDARSTGVGCYVRDTAVIRDSICVGGDASFESGVATYVGSNASVTVRNVTAVGFSGVYAGTQGSGAIAVIVSLRNVIALGTGAVDITTDNLSTNPGATTAVNAQFSNYDAIEWLGTGESATAPGSGANQIAVPIFVNQAGGDFRQALGSPTINAGATDASTGTTDLEGDPRPQGAAIDIGADEADGIAPETTLVPPPPAIFASYRFTYSSSEPGTIACTLDGSPVACDPSGYTTPTLPPGSSHTFAVAATDLFGNTDPTPASHTFPVAETPPPLDRTAPNTKITAKPKPKTKAKTALFEFRSTESGSTFECKFDNGGYTFCTSPKPFSKLKKGKHAFSVRAKDASGNVDASPANYSWKVKKKKRKKS